MKFWVFSDLHMEAQQLSLPDKAPNGAEAILCAGDLAFAADLEKVAGGLSNKYGLDIYIVPGNHEFYRGYSGVPRFMPLDRVKLAENQQSEEWPASVRLLDDQTAYVGDCRIIGGTLWTDFLLDIEDELDLPWRMLDSKSMLPDFSQIRMSSQEMISPQDMLDMHRVTREFILQELMKPFDGPTIVLTHHLPHPDCTPDLYKESKSNFLFASSEHAFGEVLHSKHAPDLWICGHTHIPMDKTIGRTRMVSNPLGYQSVRSERENGFIWDFVIEV